MIHDLTIIIVNWNTREPLCDCLRSLPAATRELAVQTVVVDNASADGSARMVRAEFPACHLIESGDNLGYTRANNLALAEADSRLVLLLNPDTICPPDSLTELCAYLDATPRAAAVGPTLVDANGQAVASYGDFPAEWHHWLSCLDPGRSWFPGRLRHAGLGRVPIGGQLSGPVDYVKGACLLLRKAVLDEIGPLDERFFMYFEESDWCRRARAAGYLIHHCAEVVVAHLEGRAAEQVSSFSLTQFQRSYRLFVAKHYGSWRLPGFRLAQLAEYTVKGLLRALAPGTRNRALAETHLQIARLQLKNHLAAPSPPGGKHGV